MLEYQGDEITDAEWSAAEEEIANEAAGDNKNIAQRMSDATVKFAKNTEPLSLELAEFLGELSAAIMELDARTAHVQR